MGICAGAVTHTVNITRYRMRSAVRGVLGIVLRNVVDSGGVQYLRPVSGIYRFSTVVMVTWTNRLLPFPYLSSQWDSRLTQVS